MACHRNFYLLLSYDTGSTKIQILNTAASPMGLNIVLVTREPNENIAYRPTASSRYGGHGKIARSVVVLPMMRQRAKRRSTTNKCCCFATCIVLPPSIVKKFRVLPIVHQDIHYNQYFYISTANPNLLLLGWWIEVQP